MITLHCAYCGAAFSVRSYRAATARYCSRRCLNLGTRDSREPARLAAITGRTAPNNAGITCVCEQCGRTFPISPCRRITTRYCSKKCYGIASRNGREKKPYLRMRVNGVRVLVHRHLMEVSLGRKLERWEHVHHINGYEQDNRIENLEVMDVWSHGAESSAKRGHWPGRRSGALGKKHGCLGHRQVT
jgi:hypothetical protein